MIPEVEEGWGSIAAYQPRQQWKGYEILLPGKGKTGFTELNAFEKSTSRTRRFSGGMSVPAIGCRPPEFFLQGRREAPCRWETTLSGMLPAQSRLTSMVRLDKAWLALSGDGQKTVCFRWLARSPEGPGAEPLGKDQRAFVTSSMETQMAVGKGLTGRDGP